MRLLLDMGLSLRTAEHFRACGHDAVHLAEQKLQRLSDRDVVQKASDEGRILITFDLDFARILALQRLARPSVILLRLTQFTTAQVNQRLTEVLRHHESELVVGAIIVIDDEGVRVRTLPVW